MGPVLRPCRHRRHRPAAAAGLSRSLPPRVDRQVARGAGDLAAHRHQLRRRQRRRQAGDVHRRQHPRERGPGHRDLALHRVVPLRDGGPGAVGGLAARRAGVLHRPDHQPRRPGRLHQQGQQPPLAAVRRGPPRQRRRRRGGRGRLRRPGRRRQHHADAAPQSERAVDPVAGGPADHDPGRGRPARRIRAARQRGVRQRRRRRGQRRRCSLRVRPEPQLALELAAEVRAGRRRLLPGLPARNARGDAIHRRAPEHRGRPDLPQFRWMDPAGSRRGERCVRGPGYPGVRRHRTGRRDHPPRLQVRRHLERALHHLGQRARLDVQGPRASSATATSSGPRSSTSRSRRSGTATTGRSTSSTGCC